MNGRGSKRRRHALQDLDTKGERGGGGCLCSNCHNATEITHTHTHTLKGLKGNLKVILHNNKKIHFGFKNVMVI